MPASKGEHDTAADRPHPLQEYLTDVATLLPRLERAAATKDLGETHRLKSKLDELIDLLSKRQRAIGALPGGLTTEEDVAASACYTAGQHASARATFVLGKAGVPGFGVGPE